MLAFVALAAAFAAPPGSVAARAEPAPRAPVAARAEPDGAELFDLELRGADVHTAIRMLADLGELDVVIPDTVYGTVSLRLDDVTWEAALAAVLYVEGLQAIPTGRILHVAVAR